MEPGNSNAVVAILAGGSSRRMGRDKTRLRLGDRSVVEHVLAAAAPLGVPRAIMANTAEAFADLGLPVHADLRPGLGPLAGLHAALTMARSAAVLLLAGDLPFLTTAFLRFLLAEPRHHQVLAPGTSSGPQPLCAVYRHDCLPVVEQSLDRGDLRMQSLLARLDTRVLAPEEWQGHDPQGVLLCNVNTPADYQQARALVDRGGTGSQGPGAQAGSPF